MNTLNKGMQCCGKCDNKARGVKFFKFSNLSKVYIPPPSPNPSTTLEKADQSSSTLVGYKLKLAYNSSTLRQYQKLHPLRNTL